MQSYHLCQKSRNYGDVTDPHNKGTTIKCTCHTVEIMGQVAKDSARTSWKALSCGSVIAWVWTGPHNYGDCRKVEGRTGSLGDPLWGKPVSATGVLARRAAENRVREGGTFCFVGAFLRGFESRYVLILDTRCSAKELRRIMRGFIPK
jgi:hypothetical protein